jgi:glucose dehydrogenase
MTKTDLKFATGQFLLIVGLVLAAIGGQWPLFIGLTLIIVSAFFGFRRPPSRSFASVLIRILLSIGAIALFVWCTSFGAKTPPLAALVGVWMAFSIDEFQTWRKTRNLT